jgi:hypothetical protein
VVTRIEGQALYEVKASGQIDPPKATAKKAAKLGSIVAKPPDTRVKPEAMFKSSVERAFRAMKNSQLYAPDNPVSTKGGDRG